MTLPQFFPGETVRFSVTFKDSAGDAVAATGVAFTVKRGDGSTTTPTPQAGEGTGEFYADIATGSGGVGIWAARAECAGPTVAAVEASFRVLPSQVG